MDNIATGQCEFPTPEMAEVYRQYMNLPPSNAAFSEFYDQAIYRIRANVNDDAAWFAILLLTIDALQELSEDAAKHCAKFATVNKFVMHRCGLVMIHQGKLDEACQLARDYLGNDPGEPLAYEILVKALHQSGDRNTMLGVFEEIAANSRRGVRYQNNVALSWSELARLRRHFQIPRMNRTALHREITLAAQNASADLFDLMTPRAITWAPVVQPDGTVALGGAIVSKEPIQSASFRVRNDNEEDATVISAACQSSEFYGLSAALGGHLSIWRAESAIAPDSSGCEVALNAPEVADIADGEWVEFAAPHTGPSYTETKQPTVIGSNGITLNAAVQSTVPGALMKFRYGKAADALTEETAPEFLPPGVNARANESMQNEHLRFFNYGLYLDIGKNDDSGLPDDGAHLAQSVISPFGQDNHHVNGSGFVALVYSWISMAHGEPAMTRRFSDMDARRALEYLNLDLRDAVMRVRLKGIEIAGADYHPLCWMTSGNGIHCNFGEMTEVSTPWLLTGDAGKYTFTTNNEWQTFDYRLRADTNDWSFSGNNVEELGQNMARYAYSPLGQCLADGRGGNLLLGFGLGDATNTPQGEIKIGGLQLFYRSYSLLAPGQGASLTESPVGSYLDPGFLTDGVRGDNLHQWCSGQNPAGPQVFNWKLRRSSSVSAFSLIQNLQFPAKEIEIQTSENGTDFQTIWKGEISRDGKSGHAVIGIEKEAFEPSSQVPVVTMVLDEPVMASHIRLVISSGYSAAWGLDQFEVFSDDAQYVPDGKPVSFSADIGGFGVGDEVFVQAVLLEGGEEVPGNVVSIQLPDTPAPIIEWAQEIPGGDEHLQLLVRANAMGAFCDLWAEVDGREVSVRRKPIGRQVTPRHATLLVDKTDVEPDQDILIIAVTDAGETRYILRRGAA